MATLTVTRKGYKRKDGTRVKSARFKIKDRGKRGRTPKAKRFYSPSVHMGWKKSQSPVYRRRLALNSHGGDYLATARALQALANVTTDNATARAARSDALYFYAKHRGSK